MRRYNRIFFFLLLSQIDISTLLEILSKLFQTKICIICIVSSNLASLAIPIPYSTYAYYIFILPSCFLSLFRLDSRRRKYAARRSILLRSPRSLADSKIRRIYSFLAKEINHATRYESFFGKEKVVYISSIDVVSFTSVRIL